MNKPLTKTTNNASDKDDASGSGGLFDLRILVAGLLLVYGLLLLGAGLFDTATTLAKADGVRINLWEGIALLAVAACFAVWRFADKRQ
jgi:hypothetical protein